MLRTVPDSRRRRLQGIEGLQPNLEGRCPLLPTFLIWAVVVHNLLLMQDVGTSPQTQFVVVGHLGHQRGC